MSQTFNGGTHTNRLTHTHRKCQWHRQSCKDFPSDVFPLAWRGTLPARHPNTPSSSAQFVSLLSIHYFKRPMTTSFNLKERGILKTTSDPPPTPGILNHPPNVSVLFTSPSMVLRHGGGGDWLVLSLILNPTMCAGFGAKQRTAVMPHKAGGGTCGFLGTSATLRRHRWVRLVCTYFMYAALKSMFLTLLSL